MRTLITIEEAQVEALDQLARKERRSRAALIRQAIDEYIGRRGKSALDDAYGLWGTSGTDGLAYQRRLRGEW